MNDRLSTLTEADRAAFRASHERSHARAPREAQPGEPANNKTGKPTKRPKATRVLEPTDDHIADAFAEEHRNDLRYVAAWSKWFEWRAGCWREEKTLRAFDLIRKTCKAQGIERAGMAKMVGAVQALVRADRRLAATIEQWDADPNPYGRCSISPATRLASTSNR